MKKIGCCSCFWLLLSFSAVGCKQTSFEKKKKRWGILETVVSDCLKNFFQKKKQKPTAMQKKKSCKKGGRNPPLQRTSETAAAATECNQQFQQLTTAVPSS
jgi:hypothetical protein